MCNTSTLVTFPLYTTMMCRALYTTMMCYRDVVDMNLLIEEVCYALHQDSIIVSLWCGLSYEEISCYVFQVIGGEAGRRSAIFGAYFFFDSIMYLFTSFVSFHICFRDDALRKSHSPPPPFTPILTIFFRRGNCEEDYSSRSELRSAESAVVFDEFLFGAIAHFGIFYELKQ